QAGITTPVPSIRAHFRIIALEFCEGEYVGCVHEDSRGKTAGITQRVARGQVLDAYERTVFQPPVRELDLTSVSQTRVVVGRIVRCPAERPVVGLIESVRVQDVVAEYAVEEYAEVKPLVVGRQVQTRHKVGCRVADNGAVVVVDNTVLVEIDIEELARLRKVALEAGLHTLFQGLHNSGCLVSVEDVQRL